ncbi:MAG TPA: hypothetical protein VNU22_02260 [Candidatus Acidoferrum sp.]|jgi:hypothetical protein|nr:hypothetical protein [Candidatus Acidoferrum sp.]
MRFLKMSLVLVAATLVVTACASKSSSNDQSQSTEATTAASSAATTTDNTAASAAPAGEAPAYPGATTQASGSNTSMGQSAAGTVMTTDDSFDKVYAWYQKNMPSGSEKSHTTAPVESAVFMVGDPGSGQTSVTITVSGNKTMITTAKVKM